MLLGGEAGIGKTTLVRTFCESAEPTRVLCGACDALLSEKNVGHHVLSILRKLGVRTRGQAAAEAAKQGIGR